MATIIPDGENPVWIEQDKDARKEYRFDMAALLPDGETLESATWATSAGLTVTESSIAGTQLVVVLSGGTPQQWYTATAAYQTAGGRLADQLVVQVFIKDDAEAASPMGSALFPNRFTAVAQLQRDRLMLAAQTHFSGAKLSQNYIWEKLCAAEAEASRILRVLFRPTTFFPDDPTDDQVAALNGMPWELDQGYDYDPDMYSNDRWGFFKTHSSPLISVQSVRFSYPAIGGVNFEIPTEWLQLDKKYGHVRIVPLSASAAAMLTPFVMQLISMGRVIPNMVHITYVAGLQNAAADYPELVDVVKKMAVLKIIEDGFLPQSGSISADGLSQSMSVDMGKYDDVIDRTLNGPPGVNGGLRAAIHGVTLGVM
jgi:hypothetical protein